MAATKVFEMASKTADKLVFVKAAVSDDKLDSG